MIKVMVLGASGMLGNCMFKYLSANDEFRVVGVSRSDLDCSNIGTTGNESIIVKVDLLEPDSLDSIFKKVSPNVVINCVGIVKQSIEQENQCSTLLLNSVLPHRLVRLCEINNSRLIHISTDCVFSGVRGMYTESDLPDATDFYGLSKLLGEVNSLNSLTIRTSIIGHGINTNHGLIDWFLRQEEQVEGYSNAIFSGLPTVEVARVVGLLIINEPKLNGLFHLSGDPISKLDLLKLVAKVYGKKIDIVPSDVVKIDRSLDSSRFRKLTGYRPDNWVGLIKTMHEFGEKNGFFRR
jgi:dTDP-4-dehydrorhamnose reductase